jgi:hypothetical protein
MEHIYIKIIRKNEYVNKNDFILPFMNKKRCRISRKHTIIQKKVKL